MHSIQTFLSGTVGADLALGTWITVLKYVLRHKEIAILTFFFTIVIISIQAGRIDLAIIAVQQISNIFMLMTFETFSKTSFRI